MRRAINLAYIALLMCACSAMTREEVTAVVDIAQDASAEVEPVDAHTEDSLEEEDAVREPVECEWDGGGRDDCESDEDCVEGYLCTELMRGGYRTCVPVHEEATDCPPPPYHDLQPSDCGCDGKVCEEGARCYRVTVNRYPFFYARNACLTGCLGDDDCEPDEACLAPGVLSPVGICVKAPCRRDSDCGNCRRCVFSRSYSGFYGTRCNCRGDDDCPPDEVCVTSRDRSGPGESYCSVKWW